ncbi:MAG: potassium transporter Trk, partial [Halobacteria archaeon]|nr:potassium transporter Trk [Halobacteria archaeon]
MKRRTPDDLATILRDIGALLLMESALMLLTAGIALVFGEFYAALGFFVASGITAGIGGGAHRLFEDAPDPLMKHGMIIAALGWFS